MTTAIAPMHRVRCNGCTAVHCPVHFGDSGAMDAKPLVTDLVNCTEPGAFPFWPLITRQWCGTPHCKGGAIAPGTGRADYGQLPIATLRSVWPHLSTAPAHHLTHHPGSGAA